MLRAESRMAPEMSAEIYRQRLRVAAQRDAEQRESQQCRDLGRGKHILNQRPGLYSKNVNDRKKNHEQDGHQILRIDSDIHVAQNNRPQRNRRNFPQVKNPVRRRNGRKEYSEELAESHAHSGNRARLNDEK